jgi:hypothetical protein
MKKIAFILFFALSLISCSNDVDFSQKNTAATTAPQGKSANKLASGVNVKLYKAWTSYSQKYGYAQYTRRFQVEVRNLAYDKKVVIMHEMADGTWKDFPLTYISSTSDNTEIWGTDVLLSNSFYVGDTPSLLFGDEFVARYEVNGVQYWDNNNSVNYKMGDLNGTFLRSDLNVTVDTFHSYIYNNYYNGPTNTFAVHADVRNLNPTKEVKVVYTTDNWATSKVASLNYTQYLTVGAAQSLISPNVFGMERWFVNIEVPSTVNNIQYAVVYKVNGVEYWDNNFGKNFIAIKK